MKISARQVRAVLDAYVHQAGATLRGGSDPTSVQPNASAPDAIRREFELLPEQRDIVVHDLRAKIRSGSYFVESSEIVDALLGRLAANLIVRH
jgi:anti-sigma28 factor (negative regulator of flagellin synthesis)